MSAHCSPADIGATRAPLLVPRSDSGILSRVGWLKIVSYGDFYDVPHCIVVERNEVLYALDARSSTKSTTTARSTK